MELATLTGTEKQVAWATGIRNDAIKGFESTRASIAKRADAAVAAGQISREDADVAIEAEVGGAIAKALSHTDAGWWIDRASKPALHILRECA